MDSVEQEDVVNLIFGDEAPEGWRENKEFLLYLTELGNLGNSLNIKYHSIRGYKYFLF